MTVFEQLTFACVVRAFIQNSFHDAHNTVLHVVSKSASVQTRCGFSKSLPFQGNWFEMILYLADPPQGCPNEVEVGRERGYFERGSLSLLGRRKHHR